MGIYFNPENKSFSKDVSGPIYVDKTGLIECLNNVINTSANCLAVSHARRFGKSQAAGMIDAYYSFGCDSRELFSRFEISQKESFEVHLNKYNVLHLDISSITDCVNANVVPEIKKRLIKDFKIDFGDVIDYDQSMAGILSDVFKNTNRAFVIIIDEWDCVVRNYSDSPKLVHEYLQFLHEIFKSEESKSFLALGYITGIMPIKKIKDESALNNFKEYTMINSKPITKYYGFTEDEVRNLCEQFDMDFDSVKNWYDGYLIDGQHMYNPHSVYNCMIDHSLESYWKNTSAFGTINNYITLNFEGLKDSIMDMLKGKRVTVNTNYFSNDLSIINSKDEALTALIHLGYLGYDSVRNQAYLPNYEVGMAYQAALATGEWKNIAELINDCEKILWATIDEQEDIVAKYIEKAHEAYTSIKEYNDENSLSCVITMAYFTAPAYYNVIREFPTGKGFADIVFIPRSNAGERPAIIIELKYDKNAEGAIKQIKDKNYIGALSGYDKDILLVGINYDKNTKKHSCVIEKY